MEGMARTQGRDISVHPTFVHNTPTENSTSAVDGMGFEQNQVQAAPGYTKSLENMAQYQLQPIFPRSAAKHHYDVEEQARFGNGRNIRAAQFNSQRLSTYYQNIAIEALRVVAKIE
jgi:hypothetical protein